MEHKNVALEQIVDNTKVVSTIISTSNPIQPIDFMESDVITFVPNAWIIIAP